MALSPSASDVESERVEGYPMSTATSEFRNNGHMTIVNWEILPCGVIPLEPIHVHGPSSKSHAVDRESMLYPFSRSRLANCATNYFRWFRTLIPMEPCKPLRLPYCLHLVSSKTGRSAENCEYFAVTRTEHVLHWSSTRTDDPAMFQRGLHVLAATCGLRPEASLKNMPNTSMVLLSEAVLSGLSRNKDIF